MFHQKEVGGPTDRPTARRHAHTGTTGSYGVSAPQLGDLPALSICFRDSCSIRRRWAARPERRGVRIWGAGPVRDPCGGVGARAGRVRGRRGACGRLGVPGRPAGVWDAAAAALGWLQAMSWGPSAWGPQGLPCQDPPTPGVRDLGNLPDHASGRPGFHRVFYR